jgi:glutamate decarboxylase
MDAQCQPFCSGGTIANITALWIARNRLLKAEGDFKGVAKEGLFRAMKYYGYEGLAILVSERGHYSLGKAADILGIGREFLVPVKTDANNKVQSDEMRRVSRELNDKNIKVMAIVGVAGTTETGNVDPLNDLADLATELGCHFHVDAAWGGATLLSDKYRHLLNGIERADSVTIDAHKQMYVPMGAGMVVFKHPSSAHAIEHHAEYILRKGSKDLGSQTLEGSRPGMAMLVHACLQVIGRQGYEILINRSLDKARYFAGLIKDHAEFELITEPELCLLTYRYVPSEVQRAMTKASPEKLQKFNELLNGLTRFIQKTQREEGLSFVSRTRIKPERYQRQDTVVFRVVLANPLTTDQILLDVLEEQQHIAALDKEFLPKLVQLAKDSAA